MPLISYCFSWALEHRSRWKKKCPASVLYTFLHPSCLHSIPPPPPHTPGGLWFISQGSDCNVLPTWCIVPRMALASKGMISNLYECNSPVLYIYIYIYIYIIIYIYIYIYTVLPCWRRHYNFLLRCQVSCHHGHRCANNLRCKDRGTHELSLHCLAS